MKKSRLNKRGRGESGYTLIEAVISLFVIGVMVVIYAVASNSVMLNNNSRHQQLANRIAASEMEDLRGIAFASLPASGAFAHSLLTQLPNGQANLQISDLNANLKEAIVTVSWQEIGSQDTHQVSLTTLLGKLSF